MRALLVVLTTLALVSGGTAPAAALAQDALECNVVAHRGDTTSGGTEEGIRSYTDAADHHADYLEGDARVTSDGKLMLMHDATVDRTTNGTGTVASKTAAQMRALDLDDGNPPIYAWQMLELAQARGLDVLLELKEMAGTASYNALAQQIRDADVERVTIESTSAVRLGSMRTALPGIKTALIRYSDQLTPAQIHGYNADGLVVAESQATPLYLASLGSMPVYVFPDDGDGLAEWVRLSGSVTGLMTNDVPGYVATMACTT